MGTILSCSKNTSEIVENPGKYLVEWLRYLATFSWFYDVK